jgi:hypothetical protein
MTKPFDKYDVIHVNNGLSIDVRVRKTDLNNGRVLIDVWMRDPFNKGSIKKQSTADIRGGEDEITYQMIRMIQEAGKDAYARKYPDDKEAIIKYGREIVPYVNITYLDSID